MRQILTMALTLLLAVAMQGQTYWNGTSNKTFSGSGTQTDPYLIGTPEQLAGLAERVNVDKEDFAGQYIKLTADIYLTNFNDTDTASWPQWEPIGHHHWEGMDNGFRDISNSVRPITGPDDLKGIKIRTPESSVFVDTFTQLGATSTAMAVSEVFSAMQLGTVDGQENPSSNFVNNKYYEVNIYYSITHHIYTAEPLIMSLDKWNSLTPEQQEILQKAADEACQFEREQSDSVDATNIDTIKEQGVEVNELTPEAIQAFKDALAPLYEKYEGEYGEMIKKLQDAAAEF